MTTHAIELRDVHAGYGRIEVLHGVDLAVPAGTVYALLGPNGAGKSTTVQGIYELVRQLAEEGITILLVEQFANTALAVADFAAVMTQGRVSAVGQPQDVAEHVSAAYLGGAA